MTNLPVMLAPRVNTTKSKFIVYLHLLFTADPTDRSITLGLILQETVLNWTTKGLMKRAQILLPWRWAAFNYTDWV